MLLKINNISENIIEVDDSLDAIIAEWLSTGNNLPQL